MSKQIQEAYIVAATRLPTAKRNGMFRHVRPDDMLAHVIKSVVAQVPGIDPARIGALRDRLERGIHDGVPGSAATVSGLSGTPATDAVASSVPPRRNISRSTPSSPAAAWTLSSCRPY
jgi:acetyl-CoA acetyltransferase